MDTTDGIDRSMGSGSRSVQQDWLDEHTTASPNDWSSAQTTFYYDDNVPKDKQSKYRRLKQWNDGRGEQNRKSVNRSTSIELDVRAFSNISELNDYQTKRVIYIIKNTNISANNFVKSYEKIILAIISLVIDDHINTEDAMENRAIYRDGFVELMDTCDINNQELRTVRQLVREKSDFF